MRQEESLEICPVPDNYEKRKYNYRVKSVILCKWMQCQSVMVMHLSGEAK